MNSMNFIIQVDTLFLIDFTDITIVMTLSGFRHVLSPYMPCYTLQIALPLLAWSGHTGHF
jgi:hypothetical protein